MDMKTLDFINEMGGTTLNLQTWDGKWLLRRIALMPAKECIEIDMNLFLGFEYFKIMRYHKQFEAQN